LPFIVAKREGEGEGEKAEVGNSTQLRSRPASVHSRTDGRTDGAKKN